VVFTIWLVLPLCGPAGLASVLLPAVGVTVTALVGLLGASATQRVWPWVVVLWLAPSVHHLVTSLIGAEYIC
jgi:uncharacterized membrane protein YeaQ/YmgE (transglycosylase-associated protein family)